MLSLKTLKDVTLSNTIGKVANAAYSDKDGKTCVAQGTTNAKLLTSTVKLKENKLGLMANAYYDFNNASEFTPYVMAGVGVTRGTLEAKVSGYEAGTSGDLKAASETIKSKNNTSFAYQVGVGVGYEMSKDIFLDVGYKMSGTSGSYKFKKADLATTSGSKFGSPKLQHTLTAGVRFAF